MFLAINLVWGLPDVRDYDLLKAGFMRDPYRQVRFRNLANWLRYNAQGKAFAEAAAKFGYVLPVLTGRRNTAGNVGNFYNRYCTWYMRQEAIRANANDEAALPKVS